MITREFVAAGHAIFTVEVPATFVQVQALLGNEYHPHYTYRVERVELKASADGRFPARTAYFVASLTGPDNTSDYTYLGELDAKTGDVRLTKKSAFPETASRVRVLRKVLARVWAGEQDAVTGAGWGLRHCGYCGKCGRLLTVPESVASGFGPECIKSVMGSTLAAWARGHADEVAAVEAAA